MCGADELPWFGRAYMSGNQLVIERAENDSGSVYVPWRIDGHGVLLVATSTLMERERPYLLEVELARGTINRLRNQVAQWEALGLIISDGMRKQILAMTHDFCAGGDDGGSGDRGGVGWAALAAAMDAMGQLAAVYAEQAIGMRRRTTPKLATWFGVHLGGEMPTLGVARQLLHVVQHGVGAADLADDRGERGAAKLEGGRCAVELGGRRRG